MSAADQKLLGFVEDMLDICGSRDLDYVCFMDTAVTVRLSHQEGSLKTFLEDYADIGGEAGGKRRNTILADFNSDQFMSVVHDFALICDSCFCLWVLLRRIGFDDEQLRDMLSQMWPKVLAFVNSAAEKPHRIVGGRGQC